MEKNRWSLIFIGLCLALAFSVSSVEAQDICTQGDFCDSDHDTFFRDHKRCDCGGIIDCNDNDPRIGGPPCGGGDDGDTKTSKKSIPLIMTFDPSGTDILSDGEPYIDNEDRVGVSAGGRSQPNPAAGIHMGLGAKPKILRQLLLDITCEVIDDNGDGIDDPEDVNNCGDLPAGGVIFGSFPDCGGVISSCDLGAAVRPYKVDCPEGDPPCLDVFTMDPNTPELMSFRLFFGGSFTVEVASAIGVDGSQDPGTCLSMLTEVQLEAFLDKHCRVDPDDPTHPGPADCNVKVTAFDRGNEGDFPGDGFGAGAGDEENDAWRVVADGVTALICDRPGDTVIGKATLTFGFDAIKK